MHLIEFYYKVALGLPGNKGTEMTKLGARDNSMISLSDVVVPDSFFDRWTTGIELLDVKLFGGQDAPGLMPSAVYLTTGTPGAGKSTLCLQMAELFSQAEAKVVYAIGEESQEQVALAARRLKLKGAFQLAKYVDINDMLKAAKAAKADILFIDSLQSFGDGDLSGPKLLKSVAKKITKFAKETNCLTFLVGHVTKGGVFAGPNEVKHDVDGHIHLSLHPKTGERVFTVEKNRFGPSGLPVTFSVGERGLTFSEAVDFTEAEGSKRTSRTDVVKSQVESLLLKGEVITGYCAPRLGLEISGGGLRAVLEEAATKLATAGHTVCEVKVNGRRGIKVVPTAVAVAN